MQLSKFGGQTFHASLIYMGGGNRSQKWKTGSTGKKEECLCDLPFPAFGSDWAVRNWDKKTAYIASGGNLHHPEKSVNRLAKKRASSLS